MNRLRRIVITGLGTGYLPVAPGTWGSAVVCVIFLAVAAGSGRRGLCVNSSLAVVAVLSSVACVWLGAFAQETFSRRDPHQCVIDEWAGQAIALLGMPLGGGQRQVLIVAGACFAAFRFFDIIKPPPVGLAERLGHGWGILLDDVVAGICANVVVQVILRLGLGW